MSTPYSNFESILRSYRKSAILLSAFELGIFQILVDKPLTMPELEQQTGYSKRGLRALLTALISMEMIVSSGKYYRISPHIQSFIDPSSDAYAGGQIEHEIYLHKRWQHLSESVRTGKPVDRNQEKNTQKRTQRFINAMSDIGKRSARLVVENISFDDNEHVLDMGGGPGRYAYELCQNFPGMHVTIFDQKETIEKARHWLNDKPERSRISLITGDFFVDSIPGKYNTLFISNVIHIFGPDRLKILFKKCRKSIMPGGRILIKDLFLNDNVNGPLNNTLFSVHMLLSTDAGKCYTHPEVILLLQKAGYNLSKIYYLSEFSSVIEAKTGDVNA